MALAHAVLAYAANIDNLGALTGAVKLIAHKHCALNVQSPHYAIVHKNLMASIGHVLGEAVTPEVGAGWSEAVLALAEILINTEEELYKMAEQRSGGWRGQKDFKVSYVKLVADGCKEVTFVPADGSSIPIDFTSGQFLTVHLKKEGATPRHYTVTSAPGKPYLQCCVKKLPGGFVSAGIHELRKGDLVGLSAPFGLFTLSEKPAVLISAGIGATPMKAFLESNVKKVRLAVHVDKSEATHPFRKAFVDSGVQTYFHYTSTKGRPTMADLVEQVKPHLADCDIYTCGPTQFLSDVKAALTEAGASNVHVDVFGPTLA
jgi:nitric oxide dioxygenase